MVTAKLSRFFGSKLFFGITIGFFVISSLWLALGSTFPMAFDEEVHYGITSMYAENLNPFTIHQTEAANKFGAVETDPSYLYYYLLSFPYRVLSAINNSQTFIVTGLRLINIGLFVGALFLYRRLLLGIGLSKKLVHLVIAIVTLIPITPMLAAEINYDNLVLVLTPLLLMSVLLLRQGLLKEVIRPLPMIAAIALALYGSVVKYAFLPIVAAAALYTLVVIIVAARRSPDIWSRSFAEAKQLRRGLQIGGVLLISVGILLFSQRYVRNYVRYQALVPDCAAVLSVEACHDWGPWGRDYDFARNKPADAEVRNPVYYTATHWAFGMWNRLFFTLAGPLNGYATSKRLPIPSMSFIVFVVIGLVSFAAFARTLIRRYPAYILFAATGALYTAALLAQQYGDYRHTAQPVAINGRYLLPFLPLFAAMLASGMVQAAHKLRISATLPAIGLLALLLFLQGGGVLTYIVRSDSSWLYNNSVVQNTDHTLKQIVRPLIIGE